MTWTTTTTQRVALWDDGVRSFSRRTVPPTEPVLTTAFLRDRVLRVANGTLDDDFIDMALASATETAEHWTGRALMPQTWELVLDAFPAGRIELPKLPLISVTDITYLDGDGAAQTLTASPEEFTVIGSGAWQPAQVVPLSNTTWPDTITQPNAVTVTYRAGYENPDDPEFRKIVMGIAVMVGELYKVRTLSVQDIQNLPSILGLRAFWPRAS